VTAHAFQLALEIIKVEALEIRAGRTAREACEIADYLLARPNRLTEASINVKH
jgi:O-acetylhomoserine/O-acetylserine sulfhydrylase-like pyridoxal-dependent enzyme